MSDEYEKAREKLKTEIMAIGGMVVVDRWGDIYVNTYPVRFEIKKLSNDRIQYDIGYGTFKSVSARNAAYYIITDYIPKLKNEREMKELLEKAKIGLDPEDSNIFMFGTECRIKCKNAQELKDVLIHLGRWAGKPDLVSDDPQT